MKKTKKHPNGGLCKKFDDCILKDKEAICNDTACKKCDLREECSCENCSALALA